MVPAQATVVQAYPALGQMKQEEQMVDRLGWEQGLPPEPGAPSTVDVLLQFDSSSALKW